MADQIQDETAAAKADEAKAELELNTTIAQPEEQAASTLEIEKRASQNNDTGASDSDGDGTSDKQKEGASPGAALRKITNMVKGFDEMIEYMDFSFEMAFQQKDNEFMLAYREHIKMIQEEINRLKVNSEDQRYM